MSDARRELGRRGEGIAARFIMARGFRIIARTWRIGIGEIDLVVQKGEEYRIIEVKTRRSFGAGYPEESITDEKLERLDELAQAFFEERGIQNPEYHIDVIAIHLLERGAPDIQYLPDIGS